MSYPIELFTENVQREVDYRYESYSHSDSSKTGAFTQWALEQLFPSLDSDQAFNLLVNDDDIGINAYFKDDESGTIYLLYAHYSQTINRNNLGQGVLYNFKGKFKNIFNLIKQEKSKTESLILNTLSSFYKDGYSISAILVLFGQLDEESASKRLEDKTTDQEFTYYDIKDLHRLSENLTEEAAFIGQISLTFKSYTEKDNPIGALIGNISAYDWKIAIENLIPQIYDANIRVPLGKTKINKEMKKTLDSDEKSLFWYYNNGITMLCRGFHQDPQNQNLFVIESPKIVNGAQTTNTILSSNINVEDQIEIMVRIIAALPGSTQYSEDLNKEPSLIENLPLNIAKYTNSQNPIESPDFRSNEDVQKQLSSKFAEIGWFYEHRRGQWGQLSREDKDNFGNNHLKMVDLAQRWFAFDGHPSIAIGNKAALFEENGYYQSIFMPERSAEEYLVSYLCFENIQNQIKKGISKAKEAESLALGTGSKPSISTKNYLMIGRATKKTTAHMTALIGRALKERYGSFELGLAKKILPKIKNGEFIQNIYSELEDTVFRFSAQLSNENSKTLYQLLSSTSSFDEMYELFEYVIEKEKGKGRDLLLIN